MGPLLFLLYINDLPAVLDPSTKCQLLADDCLVYRDIYMIYGPEDQIALQHDPAGDDVPSSKTLSDSVERGVSMT